MCPEREGKNEVICQRLVQILHETDHEAHDQTVYDDRTDGSQKICHEIFGWKMGDGPPDLHPAIGPFYGKQVDFRYRDATQLQKKAMCKLVQCHARTTSDPQD